MSSLGKYRDPAYIKCSLYLDIEVRKEAMQRIIQDDLGDMSVLVNRLIRDWLLANPKTN